MTCPRHSVSLRQVGATAPGSSAVGPKPTVRAQAAEKHSLDSICKELPWILVFHMTFIFYFIIHSFSFNIKMYRSNWFNRWSKKSCMLLVLWLLVSPGHHDAAPTVPMTYFWEANVNLRIKTFLRLINQYYFMSSIIFSWVPTTCQLLNWTEQFILYNNLIWPL